MEYVCIWSKTPSLLVLNSNKPIRINFRSSFRITGTSTKIFLSPIGAWLSVLDIVEHSDTIQSLPVFTVNNFRLVPFLSDKKFFNKFGIEFNFKPKIPLQKKNFF